MNQSERAAYFRQLHTERPLILPNAWDAVSARIIELAGAKAIATTSAGVSWTYGQRDGETLRREQMLQTVRQIVEAVDIPVSADVESSTRLRAINLKLFEFMRKPVAPEDLLETVSRALAQSQQMAA